MKRLQVLIILFLLTGSCEDPCCVDNVYSIWLKNESNVDYAFLVSYNYPDTTIPDEYNHLVGVPINAKVPFDSNEKWEKVFEELPADTLSFFLFDNDTILEYDWSIIREEYKILERIDVSLKDLENMNWIISYP